MIIGFMKLVFVTLLKFERPLTAHNLKCLSLDNQSCIVRPPCIDLNPNELYYYPLLFRLGRFGRCCNILVMIW